ncbi:MAG: hypothetical protein K5893_06035, partial [Prevotella sp.]|nr:hypothetical protein [Prevotella sp.]
KEAKETYMMKKTYIVPKAQIERVEPMLVILAGSGTAHTSDNTTVVIDISDTPADNSWEGEAKSFVDIWNDDV